MRTCQECGSSIAHRGPDALSCSTACRQRAYRRRATAARERERAVADEALAVLAELASPPRE